MSVCGVRPSTPLTHTASPWSVLHSWGPWPVSMSSPGSPGPGVPACSTQAFEPPECWAGLPARLFVQDSETSLMRAAQWPRLPPVDHPPKLSVHDV